MDKKYKCKHCDQVFGLVQNRNRHEKVGIFLFTFSSKLKLHQLKFRLAPCSISSIVCLNYFPLIFLDIS